MHIKRDGGLLCKPSKTFLKLIKKEDFIAFNKCHKIKVDEKRFCSDCVKRYFDILQKLTIII